MWDLFLIVVGSTLNFKIFRLQREYFSIHEITTGFEEKTFFAKALKLSAPFFIGAVFSIVLHYLQFDYSDSVAIGVGLFFPLYVLIPILLNRELTPWKVVEQNRRNELLILLVLFAAYFGLASKFGFSFGDWVFAHLDKTLLPSKQGLVDNIYWLPIGALILWVWQKAQERLF